MKVVKMWDKVIKGLALAAGAIAGWFGEWNALLTGLAVMMVIDYVTGCMVAFMGKSQKTEGGHWLSSEGFKGLLRKSAIVAMVLLGTLLDRAIGTDGMVFQTATACYYIANEGLSVLENVALIGVPVPNVVKKALEVLKERGEGEKHGSESSDDEIK